MDHLATQVAINVGVGCVAAAGAVVGTQMWEKRRAMQETRRRCLEESQPVARKVWVEMDPNAQSISNAIESLFDANVMPYTIRQYNDESFREETVGVYVVHHNSYETKDNDKLRTHFNAQRFEAFQARYSNAIMLVIYKDSDMSAPRTYTDLDQLKPKTRRIQTSVTRPLLFVYSDFASRTDIMQDRNRINLRLLQTFVTDALYEVPTRGTRYV